MAIALNLQTVPGRYAIARLPADADCPSWLNGAGLSAMVRAADELTLVCAQDRVPDEVTADRDWICLRSVGPFAFDAAGIVHAIITPLSTQGIGVFVLCTFDGEHVLIAAKDENRARAYLTQAGHTWD